MYESPSSSVRPLNCSHIRPHRLSTDSLQVLRWSALIAGVFYGFTHQRTITAQQASAHAKAEYDHKADLIQKAKLEWAKKTLPPQAKTAGGDSMWQSPRLDVIS